MYIALRHLLLTILVFFFISPLFSQVQIGSSIEGKEEREETGFAIDLNENGTRVVIGAAYFSPTTFPINQVGKIFVMDLLNEEWQPVGTEIIGLGRGQLGYSVSMSDDGSRFVALSRENSSARIWELENGEWALLGESVASEEGEFMATVVSMSGDGKRIALGIPRSDIPGTDAGLVRIYELNNNTWQLVGEQIAGAAPKWAFGFDLDLSRDGSRVVIGASGVPNDDGATVGAVQVYDEVDGQWEQVGQTLSVAADTSGFGTVVDMSADGKTIVAGMPRLTGSEGEGQVITYEEANGDWVEFGSSPLMAATEEREYGRALSLSADGNRLAVGALRRIVLYEKNNGEWATVVGELPTSRTAQAVAIARGGRYLAYGDRGRDNNTGVVRVYDMDRVVGTTSPISPYSVNLYPNPTADQLNITGPAESMKTTPRLYHPDGSAISADLKMTRPDEKNILLDLSSLSPGLYRLELEEVVYKVIKE